MHKPLMTLAGGALLAALGAAAPQAATAADAAGATGADTGLQEVVVTAERRTEKLMDVPMSITALGQEALSKQGIANIDQLAQVAPGMTFVRNGMGSSSNYNDEDSDISIRGIESTVGSSTTGIYIDDTPIQTRHLAFGSVNPFPAIFDLERVEVLKGPQGTLFGAGSEGGNLRFIMPTPSLTQYSGFALAEVSQTQGGGPGVEIGAAFGGPIIDGKLGFRISASFREDAGWVDRVNYSRPPSVPVTCAPGSSCDYGFPATVYTGTPAVLGTTESNANWQDTDTFRAALRWAPTDNITVDPSVYVQSLHINDTAAYWENLSQPSSSKYRNGNLQRNPSTDPWYIGALKVTWDLPTVELTSNTSYLNRQQHSVSDYSQWIGTVYFLNQYPAPGDYSSAYFTDYQNNISQELRASSRSPDARLQWTTGVFYTHAYENSTEYIISPDVAPDPPFAGNLAFQQPFDSMLDKQIAVFGEASYRISELFKVTAGLRYSHLEYTGVVQSVNYGAFGDLVTNSTNSATENPVTPRFVFSYTPDADSLYYASAAKGFRPGGVNTSLPSNCTAGLPPLPTTYSSDSLWQYEIGSKNTLLDHRLTVSGSLYYIVWKDIQQFVYLTCGEGFGDNLGEVRSKGGELAVNWHASDALSLGVTAAYTDAPFSGPVALQGLGGTYPLVSDGDHLPAWPWTADLHAEYTWRNLARQPYARLDFHYASAQHSLTPYLDPANAPNDDPTLPGLPEVKLLSLRAGMHFGDVDLSLFVQNALNYHTPIFVSRDLATTALNGYVAADGSEVNFDTNYMARGLPPRTYGMTATYRF